MKTILLRRLWPITCAAALAATTFQISADQAAAPTAKPEKTYTGTIAAVDPKERTLEVKGFVLSKQFNLGDSCAYILLDKNSADAGDLRPGEKITVTYQNANGVLVADRVEQKPMTYEGMVETIDPSTHALTLHLRGRDEIFQVADDCKVVLRDDAAGTLADIQPGDHVTVTYEVPGNKMTARQIEQTSQTFTGALTAIDLSERTVKAKALLTTKKFNLADNCAIVINGKVGGQLSDLKPNDELVFNYDEVNGVNVVNRIATTAKAPAESATTQSASNN